MTQPFQDTLFTRHYLVILTLYLNCLRTLGTLKSLLEAFQKLKICESFHFQNCQVKGDSQAKTVKSLNVFRKLCAGGLWDSGQESLDPHKKPLILFKQPRSKVFDKETQQTPSVNLARKAEAIFNTVLCVMQLFPHAIRETRSIKDACVCKCGRSTPFTGNSTFGTAEHELNGVISSNIYNCLRYTTVKNL